ncbi:SMI1/KNR4 family protein [Flavobacterium pectinovorum]|uniref:SMI1/KNR4 family protein n=1 Tax=Flavobacterium pectinovorum TaxID=29533 RepID=UPI001FAD23C1|nr:SMI1/KNR4 family protein [Flavobacterium pectinovorum]MCI9845845.1 SMI1/KNR4 family protein [Flavobacterium pectinovorum]
MAKKTTWLKASQNRLEKIYSHLFKESKRKNIPIEAVNDNDQTESGNMMKSLVELIKHKHQEDGIDINPPAKLSEIIDFEKQIGFSLPADFKEFYLTCNGFECNEDIFRMVPLSEIRLYKKDFGQNWFYFSEYMIYCDTWGLRQISTGQYEIFNGSFSDKAMTSSLIEFLQRFLRGNVFEIEGLYDWQEELGIKEQR